MLGDRGSRQQDETRALPCRSLVEGSDTNKQANKINRACDDINKEMNSAEIESNFPCYVREEHQGQRPEKTISLKF